MDDSLEIWLCLSGGNALGAYHAGAYSALHEAGIIPTRIAGTSVGAIVGALIAGNRPEDRQRRLAEFWELAADDFAVANFAHHWDGSKIASSFGTLFLGRPRLFQPSLGQWWRRFTGLSSPSLFERSGLRAALERLIDFDYLNRSDIRLVINATDVRTGLELIFDSVETTITAEHLMASSAFPLLYAPELLDGRHMVDGGLAANLPVLALFRDLPTSPVKCLAFDLVSAHGHLPKTLDDAVHRMQDLLLANQSKRSIELLEYQALQWTSPISLLHIGYRGEQEVGGKMLEFSRSSMKARNDAGRSDAEIAMRWLTNDSALPSADVDGFMSYTFGHRPAKGLAQKL
jgi:NTE family protein